MKRMKKNILNISFVFYVIFLLFFLYLFLHTELTINTISTQIFITNNNKNIGNFKQNEKIKHDFYVYNLSLKKRKIDYINVDCKCSTLQNTKDFLKPFEKYTISMITDTEDMIGEQGRLISIKIADLKKPIYMKVHYVVNK